ncbi:unnamed protein product [Prorocentrum cordatum]|uniref:Uncharacterized protein n=1 Tax=Prorocentrum cordatum TaxID=2364126 RepID=A0ABN9VGK4_9DINO|nr:unnamed protein product [Polarella glacialis]
MRSRRSCQTRPSPRSTPTGSKACMFNSAHVPMGMKRRKKRGSLFISIIDPATADAMYQSSHRQTMPGVSLAGKTLEITPADVQGFKENFERHVESEAPFLECFRCVL